MKYSVFAILAIILAYGPEWIPLYARLFLSDEVSYVGSLRDFETTCREPARQSAVCYHEYILPPEITKTAIQNSSVGLGITLVATEIYCGTSNEPIAVFDDPSNPGRSYQSYNNYIVVPLQSNCREGMTIRVWARGNSTRHGLVGGRLTIGSDVFVNVVKYGTEFLTKDIRILVLLLMIFSYLIYWNSSTLSESKITEDPFERYSVAWIGFLFVSSGIVQIIIPIHTPGFYTRLSAFFSFAAHVGPFVQMFWTRPSVASTFYGFTVSVEKIVVYSFAIALAFSSYLLPVFGALFLTCGLSALLLSIYKRLSSAVIYSLILTGASLKLLNIPYTPLSHLTTFYVVLIFMDLSIKRLWHSKHLLNTIRVGRKLVGASDETTAFTTSLADTAKQLFIGRLTIIELGLRSDCTITYVDLSSESLKTETFIRAVIPPIAAHAITSKSSVWHISEGSENYRNIMRSSSENGKYINKFFSVIPLMDTEEVVAVLSITNYGDDIQEIKQRHELRESTLSILTPYFIESVKKRRNIKEIQENVRLSIAQRSMDEIATYIRSTNDMDKHEVLLKILKICLEVVGTSGFISEVDPKTRKLNILAIHGYSTQLTHQLLNGTIIASPNNQHGPVAISYNQSKVIIVSDVDQIEHVLNPISLKILRDNETRSLASIPIRICDINLAYNSEGLVNPPWGLLWIEQSKDHEITLAYNKIFEIMQTEIESLLRVIADKESVRNANRAMAGLMPSWAADELLRGGKPIEIDSGFIIMLDLKASSKISTQIGSERWIEFISTKAVAKFEMTAGEFGFKLHQVIWDAFYFCSSSASIDFGGCDRAFSAVNQLISDANELYRECDFHLYHDRSVGSVSARACVAFGDTTRGLTPGPSPTWSVTGASMAVVSKLEQVAKGISGDIFTFSLIANQFDQVLWSRSQTVVESANDEVVFASHSDLESSFNKIAPFSIKKTAL